VTLQEAILGATITVPTVDGKVAVKVPRGSNNGTMLRLKGRGVTKPKSTERGDQYVKLVVVLPDRLDPDLIQFMERWGPAHGYDVRRRVGLED
jgi:DnaJ-class molecular chaperone